MWGRNHIAFTAAVWALSLIPINGDYTLDITINSYSNPSNRAVRWNGGSCDGDDDNGCENQFHISTRPLLISGHQRDTVVIPSTHTGYRDSQVRNLHVTIMSKGRWPGRVQIYIAVIDIDTSSSDDLVDTFTINASLQVGDQYTSPRTNISANRYARITLSFRVMCADNYYRQDCSTFCLSRDNETGHYTCDKEGNKLCLEGFGGGNCDRAISSQLWRTATPTNVIKITTPLPDHGHTVIVADVTRPVESPLIVNSSWHTIQPTTVFSSLASSVVSFSTAFSHPASSVASSSATFSSLASSVAPTSSVASPSTTFSSLASSVAPTSSMSSSSTTFRNPTGASLVMVSKSASFTYVTPSNIVFRPGGLAGFNTGIAWGVGIGVGGTALLMSMCLGLFCCVVCIRRRLKSFTLDKADFDDSAHEDGAVVITNFEHKNEFYDQDSSSDPPYKDPASTEDGLYNQLKESKLKMIPSEAIEVGLPLGKGHFGVVDHGIWNDSSGMIFEVALKSANPGASMQERIKLLQEAAIMAQFRNPNVLQIYGAVVQPGLVMLVLEICHSGDLKRHLKSISHIYESGYLMFTNLSNQLLGFSRDVATGMYYLSTRGFVHRDLAARNILVTAGNTCKISDFGMSRDLLESDGTYYISTSALVPVKWSAPEAISDSKFSTASDVWSYGCLLYEIWSLGRDPFEDIHTAEVLKKIDSGYKNPPPPGCHEAIYQLMTECWQVDHHRRPSFKEILMVLMVLPQKAIRVQATCLLLEDDDAYYNAIRMAQKPPKDSDTGLYSKLDRSK